MDYLGIGVADDRHIEQAGSLVRDDKALAVGAHLGNGVGDHLYALAKQVAALSVLFGRRALEQVVRLFQYGKVAERLVHAICRSHSMLLQLENDEAHEERLCLN